MEAAGNYHTPRIGAAYFISTNAYTRKTYCEKLDSAPAKRMRRAQTGKFMFRESEEFYHNLIAQVKDYAIFTTDPRGVITTWNEGCKKVLGYDRDEFIGQHILMVFPP
jgi:PAS domain-containing protein